MTTAAADPLGDVNGMIEVDEVRQLVHAAPLEGPSACECRTQGGEDGSGLEQLRVAGHAGRERRNACESGAPDGAVAVPARDPIVTRVMLVAEGNDLRHRITDGRLQLDVAAPEEETRHDDRER